MVLDTHVWLWWLSDPTILSVLAREAIEESVSQSRPLSISVISSWEIALLVKKGRLQLDFSVSQWVEKSEALGLIDFIPITNSIALRSVELEMHPDPADRMIVATALELNQPLLTKDEKLLSLPFPTLW